MEWLSNRKQLDRLSGGWLCVHGYRVGDATGQKRGWKCHSTRPAAQPLGTPTDRRCKATRTISRFAHETAMCHPRLDSSCQQHTIDVTFLSFLCVGRTGQNLSASANSEIADGNISYLATTGLPACDIILRLGAAHDSYDVFHWWCIRQISWYTCALVYSMIRLSLGVLLLEWTQATVDRQPARCRGPSCGAFWGGWWPEHWPKARSHAGGIGGAPPGQAQVSPAALLWAHLLCAPVCFFVGCAWPPNVALCPGVQSVCARGLFKSSQPRALLLAPRRLSGRCRLGAALPPPTHTACHHRPSLRRVCCL